MKIYRIEILSESGESLEIQYFEYRLDAVRAAKENKNSMPIHAIDFKLSKPEVLRLLNTYGSHADNG